MANLTIRTNNVPRDIILGHEIPDQYPDFDYLTKAEFMCRDFVTYKGHTYDIGEFMTCYNTSFPDEWHGYSSDSFFSGVLLRYTQDMEQVIMGTYIS